jgi:hypothetical protein
LLFFVQQATAVATSRVEYLGTDSPTEEHPTDGPFWVHTRDLEGAETQAKALHAASITDSKLKDTTEVASSRSRSNDSVLHVHNRFTTDRLNAFVVSGLTKDELASLDGVTRVSPDIMMHKYETANWGTDRSDQTDLPLSGSYTPSYCGTDVDVYVLDTGKCLESVLVWLLLLVLVFCCFCC